MATVSGTLHRRSTTKPAQIRPRLRRATRPTPAREQRLAGARAAEARARHDLAATFTRMEHDYALAVRILEEFEGYWSGVHQRLQMLATSRVSAPAR
jgi:hypothetical protein